MSLAIVPPATQGIAGVEGIAPTRNAAKRAQGLSVNTARVSRQAAMSSSNTARQSEPADTKNSTSHVDFVATWINLMRRASEEAARTKDAVMAKADESRVMAQKRPVADRVKPDALAASNGATVLAWTSNAVLGSSADGAKNTLNQKQQQAIQDFGSHGQMTRALAEDSKLALDTKAQEKRNLAVRGNEVWRNVASEAFAAPADFLALEGKKARAESDGKVAQKEKESEGAASRAKRLKLSVQDARPEAEKLAALTQMAKNDEAKSTEGLKPGSASIETREIVVLLGDKNGASAPSEGSAIDKARSSGFQALLSQALRQDLGTSIAHEASIVLERSGEGRIKLNLRPESLGNVKIDLNLKEGELSGKIVVRTEEAKEAFEEGMAELFEAFEAEGFSTPKLEVSVNSGRAWAENQGSGMAEDGPFYSQRLKAFDAEGESVSDLEWSILNGAEALLDLYA